MKDKEFLDLLYSFQSYLEPTITLKDFFEKLDVKDVRAKAFIAEVADLSYDNDELTYGSQINLLLDLKEENFFG